MAKKTVTKRVEIKARRLRSVKTRANESAMWTQNGGEPIRIRDMEDAHLLNTTHYVERALVTYDKAYGELLREARFRGLLLR